MHDWELDQLQRYPDCQVTLRAYDRSASTLKEQPDHDGWLPRLNSVTGVRTDRLPSVHGRLIALGCLKFDLGSREVGLRYQLTPLGRQLLEGRTEPFTGGDPSQPSEAA